MPVLIPERPNSGGRGNNNCLPSFGDSRFSSDSTDNLGAFLAKTLEGPGERTEPDGNSSDEEGMELEDINESLATTLIERRNNEDDFHVKEVSSGNIGFIVCKRQGQFEDGNEEVLFNSLPNAPETWVKPPRKSATEPTKDFCF